MCVPADAPRQNPNPVVFLSEIAQNGQVTAFGPERSRSQPGPLLLLSPPSHAARRAMDEGTRLIAFGEWVRRLSANGESAYPVDGQTTLDVPVVAFRGRAGTLGKTFSGVLNVETGEMRIDCAEAPEFWLEINFNKIPGLAAAPGGVEADAAQQDFEFHVDAERASKKAKVESDGSEEEQQKGRRSPLPRSSTTRTHPRSFRLRNTRWMTTPMRTHTRNACE